MRGSLNFDLKLVQKMTSSLLESLALGEQESAGILVKGRSPHLLPLLYTHYMLL